MDEQGDTADAADMFVRGLQQVGANISYPVRPGYWRVVLHYRSEGKANWTNEMRYLSRVPAVGECLVLESPYANYYVVQLVVHMLVESDFDAEIYAVGRWYQDVHREAFTDIP